MKNLKVYFLAIIAIGLFSLVSCQKDEDFVAPQPFTIFTDEPPVALQGEGSQYDRTTTVWLDSTAVSKVKYLGNYCVEEMYRNCEYCDWQSRTICQDRYRIKGRTYFGICADEKGIKHEYVSQSTVNYVLTAPVWSVLKKVVDLKKYALGEVGLENQNLTGTGWEIMWIK